MSRDLPHDWHLDFDEDGKWIDDPEPALGLAELLAPSPAMPRKAANREASRLLAERVQVVVLQRRAAVNGTDTKDLAAHLAAEAGDLWDRAAYVRKHRREPPSASVLNPDPGRRRRSRLPDAAPAQASLF